MNIVTLDLFGPNESGNNEKTAKKIDEKTAEKAIAIKPAVVEEKLPVLENPEEAVTLNLAPLEAVDVSAANKDGGNNNLPPAASSTGDSGDDMVLLKDFSKRAYTQYAVSVVKSRALPSYSDGQKPVQRRILFAMNELGLGSTTTFKKSARIVGDVIGKYHPHGDTAAYDALVRMAQGFVLRYPLIDGQGNFGSRDGDLAAAMRYTESRMTKYAELMLNEIGAGTVDYKANYDGTELEPALLPARMPFLLLNGASGIAVGMATECPPHNMREVAKAAVAHLKGKIKATGSTSVTSQLMQYIKGPDYPGGAQLVSSSTEIHNIYESGRGSLRVRSRWDIEQQARGQWRMVINELPYGVSSKMVLEQLAEMSEPKIKPNKKELTTEQKNIAKLTNDYIEMMRDESGKDADVRFILEPKTSKIDQEQLIAFLLKHTSLEVNIPVNLTMIGLDGKPDQKCLFQMLDEWTQYRTQTVTRRTQHRLDNVQKRLHILEGRMIAFLSIDKIIKVIRESDDPDENLMRTFGLSAIQTKDILEIRLRQLARLEGIRIEKEISELKVEEGSLKHLLDSSDAMRDLIISEIEADSKKYGDDRRTVVQEAERMSIKAATVADEPCTIILSKNGWIKQRTGHDVETASMTFKDGDSLLSVKKTRTIHPVILIDSKGRAYTLNSTDIPGGRSEGLPVASLVELQAKAKIVSMIATNPATKYLFSTSAGYGFIATIKNLVSRQKAGKSFMSIEDGISLLDPVVVGDASLIVAIGSAGKLLAFPLSEMKELSGGKGVIVLGMADNEEMLSVITIGENNALKLTGAGRGDKVHEHNIKWGDLQAYISRRAKKGLLVPVKFKVTKLLINS